MEELLEGAPVTSGYETMGIYLDKVTQKFNILEKKANVLKISTWDGMSVSPLTTSFEVLL